MATEVDGSNEHPLQEKINDLANAWQLDEVVFVFCFFVVFRSFTAHGRL